MEGHFRVGPWLVQPGLNAVSRGGMSIHLTPKAMEVLVCLAEHASSGRGKAGEPISKEKLLQAVWTDTFVSEDVLKGAISELRRVFEDDAKEPHIIQTIAKRGYRLIAPIQPPYAENQNAWVLFVMRRIRPWVVTGAAVFIAMLSVGAYLVRKNSFPAVRSAAPKIKLAVLPLTNLSGDPEQEYFSDGMTEEIITEVGRMQPERLGVIARTSAMLYKNTRKDLRQICRELGVEYALEGSIILAGNRARITAQLIQCGDQTHVWADSFERDLENILALQSGVAQAIAQNVKLTLSHDTKVRLAGTRRVNPEAYQDYLRGLHLWERLTPGAVKAAIKYFQAAIDEDPTYAPAYAQLANCYYLDAIYTKDLSPHEAYSRARRAATRAATLDENSGEAHASLAQVAENDWDWPAAEREFRLAIELDSNLAVAHLAYAHLLMILRRPEESWNELRTAQALDPISRTTGETWVMSLCYSRRCGEAIAFANQWLELYPDSLGLHNWLAESYAQRGQEALAVKEYLKAEELSGSSPSRIAALEKASGASGLRGLWQKKLSLDEEAANQGFGAYAVAQDSAILGDPDKSLLWLEKAYKVRDWGLIQLSVDPHFDVLRSDPRFQDLLRRIGLPQ